MSRLNEYLKETATGDYLKLEKNSSVTIRFLTIEPLFSLPVWLEIKGKRKKFNSISLDSEGRKTKYRCPLLPLYEPKDIQDKGPRVQLCYLVYNFDTAEPQIITISQRSILSGIASLEAEIAKMNAKKKGKPKGIGDFKITITRKDDKKTEYFVSFAPDATEPWAEEELEVIDRALDEENPNAIIHKLRNEVAWPTQKYIDECGLDVTLPPLSADDQSKQFKSKQEDDSELITESDIPF
jgi:hypothetical protein